VKTRKELYAGPDRSGRGETLWNNRGVKRERKINKSTTEKPPKARKKSENWKGGDEVPTEEPGRGCAWEKKSRHASYLANEGGSSRFLIALGNRVKNHSWEEKGKSRAAEEGKILRKILSKKRPPPQTAKGRNNKRKALSMKEGMGPVRRADGAGSEKKRTGAWG